MDKFKNYDIAFTGLKTGKHGFKFEVNQTLFDLFGTEQEFINPKIIVDVTLEKHTTFLEFWINIHGTLELTCDISNVQFDHPIEYQLKLLVKQGEEFDDSNEEVITIPYSDSQFNIAQFVYEGVTLSVPMKKLSPELEDDDSYHQLLEKYSFKEEEQKQEPEEKIDPRWEALKKLKDNN